MKNRGIILLAVVLSSAFFKAADIAAQDKSLRDDARMMLTTWTYEDVIKAYGEGENIIGTISGKDYIAGFRYNQTWFNRPCQLEFYFTDVYVSKFLLKFIHPNYSMLEKIEKEKTAKGGSGKPETNIIPDSVWAKRLKENPNLMDSLKQATIADFVYRKSLLEQDSLRSDSLIRDLSLILGKPLKEGVTPHTDKSSRYFATWIRNGFSCSLVDYFKYAEVTFAVSPGPEAAITAFNLDPGIRILDRQKVKVKSEVIEVSLLGLPEKGLRNFFTDTHLLVTTASGAQSMADLPEEKQRMYLPEIELIDLTGDGIEDVWLKAALDEQGSCRLNMIYTLELIEPLLIFDPAEDLEFMVSGEFQDDYQAMILLEGYPRTYIPLQKDDPVYDGLYNEAGKLLKEVIIESGCVSQLDAAPYTSKKAYQFTGHFDIHGITADNKIGTVQAIWDFNAGSWDLRSVEIIKD